MILRYCDACGQEIKESCASTRLKAERSFRQKDHVQRTKIEVEIHVAVNGTWNGGDVCRNCVIDTVDTLDGRPKAASA